MHYIITDIHNDSWRFMKLLEKMDLKEDDHLYLLGDLFDRCMDHPDPAGVYFQVLKLGKKCTVIRGNHDHWLANYIFRYYGMDERDRALLQPYPYNSFHLLQERLTEVDLKAARRAHPFLAGTGGNRGRRSAVSACPCLYGRTGKMETGQLLSDGGFVVQGFSS